MRQLKITKSITNRESASLDKYLQEIGREELISVEEEVELAQRIKKGDQSALEKLTRANLRFVVSVAKQYQNQGLSLPDLINEGNLGLIYKAEEFDETRGCRLITYADSWIHQFIRRAVYEQNRIVSRTFLKFEKEHERKPSVEELAEELELPADTVTDALRVVAHFFCRNTCVDELLKGIGILTERGTLTERESDIVKLYFGIGCQEMTLKEIGERFGLTRERVRQIKNKAIRRIGLSSFSLVDKYIYWSDVLQRNHKSRPQNKAS